MTQKQRELAEGFLSNLEPEQGKLYWELIFHLSHLGYRPVKQGDSLVFRCRQHHKHIAKMGFSPGREPFFALRFSACKGYSQRFEEIVREAVSKEDYKALSCMEGGKAHCRGPVDQRVYACQLPGGEKRYFCGAIALKIPNLSQRDVGELKKLMEEEHRFLMEYGARPSA